MTVPHRAPNPEGAPDGAPGEHGGQLAAWAARLGRDATELVDFSVSLNPLGPPPDAVDAARASLLDPARYPDPRATAVRDRLARWLDLPPACVVLGAGATDLIFRAAQLTVAQTTTPHALVLGPTFSEYARALRAVGGSHQLLAPTDAPPTTCADLGFACRPNSPTGDWLPRADLDRWRPQARRWLIDEAFIELADPPEPDLARAACDDPALLVLRSLTKLFACPWLRLGYLVAHPDTARRLDALIPPWSISGPAQAFAGAALADRDAADDHVARTRAEVRRLRQLLEDGLAGMPALRPRPSIANFVLIDVDPDAIDADALQASLAADGLIVRGCRSIEGLERANALRVGLRPEPDLRRLIAALSNRLS